MRALYRVLISRKDVLYYIGQGVTDANADISIKGGDPYLKMNNFLSIEGCTDNVYMKNDSLPFINHPTVI